MTDNLMPLPAEYVYALDIGTRNVVGVIAVQQADGLRIIDYVSKPHVERAMYDGQIHEIEAVAKIVRQITDELELNIGYHLKEVSIAAAGRALVTKHISIDRDLDPAISIDEQLLNIIEIEAIQASQKEVENINVQVENSSDLDAKNKYFCIGYSVVRYYIDGIEIKNPLEHRGNNLKLDLISTFLPQSVVDSLYKVIEKTGLYVKNITLEPIAAIKISIPDKFRLLNLALVDIGAGTSDIAITKDGHIFSYGMIDVAGDEITESIVREYLVDFDIAERLKKEISNQSLQTHEYTDILGFENEVEKTDIIAKLSPILEDMSDKIVDGIVEANGGVAPSAVFLIGGGCQFPTFKEMIANKLNLPQQRVAIKDITSYSEFVKSKAPIIGPENVTPIGIALHSISNKFSDFIQIHINDNPITLFNVKDLKLAQALAMAGFKPRQLLPKNGATLSFIVNGEAKKLFGTKGEPAQIYVNGVSAKLDIALKNKDVIYVQPAINGMDAKQSLDDYLEIQKFVYFKGEKLPLKYNVEVNTKPYLPQLFIQDGDVINYKEIIKLSDLAEFVDVSGQLLVNSKVVPDSYKLRNADVIEFATGEHQLAQDQDFNSSLSKGQESKAELIEYEFWVNNKHLIVKTHLKALIFVDIFNYIDFDTKDVVGKVSLKLNGNPARYTDSIKSGDYIEIFITKE